MAVNAESKRQKLYRITDVMEILACSRAEVYKKIKAGELRALKDGRSARVPSSEVDRFLVSLYAANGYEPAEDACDVA